MLISVQMALDSLSEQVELLRAAEANTTRQRAIRDNLIRDALRSKVSYRELGRRTGLSRERLNTLAALPDIDVSQS